MNLWDSAWGKAKKMIFGENRPIFADEPPDSPPESKIDENEKSEILQKLRELNIEFPETPEEELRKNADEFVEEIQAEFREKGLSEEAIQKIEEAIQKMAMEKAKDRAELIKRDRVLIQLATDTEKLRELAENDKLTGLPRREMYDEWIKEEVARALRSEEPLTMAMIDIDRFKSVNDDYGHAAGDKILTTVAQILNKTIRETDMIARYGGEEIAVIFPSTDIEGAKKASEKLVMEIEKQTKELATNGEINRAVTISAGYAEFDPGKKTAAFLQNAADKAVYAAKGRGRNRAVSYNELSEEERKEKGKK